MSIHADDEFNLRLALMSELDDVAPGDGLAGLVIARHRKVRRLRFAGVCGLFVVFAGIGVPIGIASASGGAPAPEGPTALRLGEYTLTLPGRYHLTDPVRCRRRAPAGCAGGRGRRVRRVHRDVPRPVRLRAVQDREHDGRQGRQPGSGDRRHRAVPQRARLTRLVRPEVRRLRSNEAKRGRCHHLVTWRAPLPSRHPPGPRTVLG